MRNNLALIVAVLVLINVAVLLLDDDETEYLVIRIIDGDTVELSNGERVRLIGIDTPEVDEYYYEEATEELRKLIEGARVSMESDTNNRDAYDRLLRYIYLGDIFVNYEMVHGGHAESYCFDPDTKYCDEFNEAEADAKENKRGMWT